MMGLCCGHDCLLQSSQRNLLDTPGCFKAFRLWGSLWGEEERVGKCLGRMVVMAVGGVASLYTEPSQP